MNNNDLTPLTIAKLLAKPGQQKMIQISPIASIENNYNIHFWMLGLTTSMFILSIHLIRVYQSMQMDIEEDDDVRHKNSCLEELIGLCVIVLGVLGFVGTMNSANADIRKAMGFLFFAVLFVNAIMPMFFPHSESRSNTLLRRSGCRK